MLKKLREKCAFTLVELIVVLVILAILAALLVPALTGYIDKSRKSQVIAETRALHEAIQTEMVEYYASSSWDKLSENLGQDSVDVSKYTLADKNGTESKQKLYNEIVSLSEVPSLTKSGQFGAYCTEDGKVAVIIYKNAKGQIGIYFGDTGEYIAYNESEFNGFNDYFNAINGKVNYTKYYQDTNKKYENPYIQKNYILMFLGYNGSN